MKTILLTGGAGFIGGHLLKVLKSHPEYRLFNIVLLSSENIGDDKTVLHKKYTFTKDDFLSNGLSDIDIVIHAGAYTPKDSANANLIAETLSNITSIYHLINNLPNIPEKFIFLSTIDVYTQDSANPIVEETYTDPISLYGWSKLYGEKILENWARVKNVTLQVLRIGHIYGSGEEKYKKLIPATIKKALSGESPIIYSHGNELRSYLHISDCVEAILASFKLNEYPGPINIVSQIALPVKTVVEVITKIANPTLSLKILAKDTPVKDLVFDNSKMQKYLSKEKITFEEGIMEEVNNFKV